MHIIHEKTKQNAPMHSMMFHHVYLVQVNDNEDEGGRRAVATDELTITFIKRKH